MNGTDLIERANLGPDKTGVDGVISVSTAERDHGPRVKWYPARPASQAPCLSMTIEATPRAFNHRLPQPVFAAAVPDVSAWVALNHRALMDFWNNGTGWMDDEVTAFKAALRKLG